jgi:hypothetical protein
VVRTEGLGRIGLHHAVNVQALAGPGGRLAGCEAWRMILCTAP